MKWFNLKPSRAIASLLIATSLFLVLTSHANPTKLQAFTSDVNSPNADRKLLLMHYMPWYIAPSHRDRWGPHWTGWQKQHNPDERDENGLPDIQSHFHPLIGPYDSSDPDVIEYHLLLMKIAGIDGVIVDWYGIANVADYPTSHVATKAMFEQTARLGMQFSICYEDRTIDWMLKQNHLTENGIQSHLNETMQWMHNHWFTQPNYVQVDGRPLLLNFGPIHVKDGQVWDAALSSIPTRPRFHALHHLWKDIAADGGFSWVHKDAWKDDANFDTVRERLTRTYNWTTQDPNQMIVSALPGFKDIYENSFGYLPHRDGETLRETLTVAMEGPWPIVQLVTWNDYGEGTIIEPTHEFGYQFLEIIQQHRQKEASRVNQSFTNLPRHLRLPKRLFDLRQASQTPQEQLDEVALLIADGHYRHAEKLIRSYE